MGLDEMGQNQVRIVNKSERIEGTVVLYYYIPFLIKPDEFCAFIPRRPAPQQ